MVFVFFFFFKQKTAYEMRISDWSSDVCSSDLAEQSDFDAGNRRLLDMIQRHAVRIDHIVRNVLDISRRQPARRDALILRDSLRRRAALYHARHARDLRSIELADVPELGRESCRERVVTYVSISVVAVNIKKTQDCITYNIYSMQ